ncbi:MAG: hypothetical protein J6S85_13900 [Methanobrevibacter sp.]|nr:hypothetical protein [Methanobrevibacter sp.]
MVKNENFYVVHGWMLNELHLKGLEKDVYAIIYGFSQTGNQHFSGSLSYLAEFTNSTKQGLQKVLKSLQEKNLIQKSEYIENNQKRVFYSAVPFTNGYATQLHGIQQSCTGVCNSVVQGMQLSCTGYATQFNDTLYNIEYKIEDTIVDSIASQVTIAESKADDCKQAEQKPQKKKESKRTYGEYQHVKLTDKQYDSLVHDYGENRIQEYIKKMDSWIQMKGKSPYKDFNLAIRQWISRDGISKLGDSKSQNDVYDEYEKNQELPF